MSFLDSVGDYYGGMFGQGPGTDTVSTYDLLPTEKRMGLDRLRQFGGTAENEPDSYGNFFAKNYQALPEGDITKRVGRVRGAYQEMFNPFLKNLQSGIDADLSRSGLLTSTRSAALRSQTLGQLAVQSALPTAELENMLEEQNRSETLRNRLAIMDRMLGVNYPGTTEIPRGESMAMAAGRSIGKMAGEVAPYAAMALL